MWKRPLSTAVSSSAVCDSSGNSHGGSARALKRSSTVSCWSPVGVTSGGGLIRPPLPKQSP